MGKPTKRRIFAPGKSAASAALQPCRIPNPTRTAHRFYVALRIRPVDEAHPDGYARDHADRGDGVAERDAVFPGVRAESLRHPSDRAVPALEAEFEEVAERLGDAERGSEQKAGEPDADGVLAPHDYLRESQLGKNGRNDFLRLRHAAAEKERREYHVDEKAGHGAHFIYDASGELRLECRNEDEPKHSPDYG